MQAQGKGHLLHVLKLKYSSSQSRWGNVGTDGEGDGEKEKINEVRKETFRIPLGRMCLGPLPQKLDWLSHEVLGRGEKLSLSHLSTVALLHCQRKN